MVVVGFLGVVFVVVWVAAPRQGVLSRMLHRTRLGLRILREDVLGLLYRLEEADADGRGAASFVRRVLDVGRLRCGLALNRLRALDLVTDLDYLSHELVAEYGARVESLLVAAVHVQVRAAKARHVNANQGIARTLEARVRDAVTAHGADAVKGQSVHVDCGSLSA